MTGPLSAKGHAVGSGFTLGVPWDPSEWAPNLSWPLNVAIYDQMRRGDAKVKSILNAVSLPIRRTLWHLEPNGASAELTGKIAADLGVPIMSSEAGATPKVARRIADRFSLRDHVRLALLSLPYGHMPFEKIGHLDDAGDWRLLRLDERLPPTIQKINVDRSGRLLGLEQYASGFPSDVGPVDEIKASALVFHSHEREGGIWQGNSILRTAYRHWLVKDRLIRVDTIKNERNGLGIPAAQAPPNASPAVIEEINSILSRWRASESSSAAFPSGTIMELVGVKGTLPDVLASIRYHDEQIGEEALAQFLDLGSTETGSRALGEAFIDFFVLSLQSTIEEIADTLNAQLVEPWVDWIDGPDAPAPLLVPGDPGGDHGITAAAIGQLVQSGALTADAGLERFLRDFYRLVPMDDPEAPRPKPAAPSPGGAVQAESGVRRLPFPRRWTYTPG